MIKRQKNNRRVFAKSLGIKKMRDQFIKDAVVNSIGYGEVDIPALVEQFDALTNPGNSNPQIEYIEE